MASDQVEPERRGVLPLIQDSTCVTLPARPSFTQGQSLTRSNEFGKGADTRNYLALVLESQGNYGEAGSLLRNAVEIDKRTTGC